jgi:hypothetical protein
LRSRESIPLGILDNNDNLAKHVTDYVRLRQNSDGGYTFCQGIESNAQDTYYGLAILKLLGENYPNAKKTVDWLSRLTLSSIHHCYYVTKTLILCGERLNDHLRDCVDSIIKSGRYFGSVNFYVEVPSEFELTLKVLEMAKLFNLRVEKNEVVNWLLTFQNKDHGFGTHRHSNINSTYYAVAALKQLDFDVENLQGAVAFLRECEKPIGGFTVVPHSLTPYMEYTYFGVMTLDKLGESCRFPSETIDFVLKCQKGNGGFSRSDIGISTFENTFQAVTIMQRLHSKIMAG